MEDIDASTTKRKSKHDASKETTLSKGAEPSDKQDPSDKDSNKKDSDDSDARITLSGLLNAIVSARYIQRTWDDTHIKPHAGWNRRS